MSNIMVNRLENSTVNTILSCFDKYKHNKLNQQNIEKWCTYNGIQTKNVLGLDDFQRDSKFQECLKKVLHNAERGLKLKLKYYWVHLIEYERGGFQMEHNHVSNEDYSSILYLNTCRGGETYFNMESQPFVSFSPEKRKIITFPSHIDHGARKTSSWFINKKVMVCGMRVL